MSAQSAIFNPTNTTSAATGDGFSVPRLTTTGRLAITFGTSDAGMMVYDTTLNNLFIWNGSAWESVPASGDSSDTQVIFNDNGILAGDAGFTYNKTQARVRVGGFLDIWKGQSQDNASTAVGNTALAATIAGATNNTAIGYRSMYRATSGSSNVSIGYSTLSNIAMTASNCTAVGAFAGQSVTSGNENTALGRSSLSSATTGGANTAVGSNALLFANSDFNTAVGAFAGQAVTTGIANVAVGSNALGNVGNPCTGNRNIMLGDSAGYSSNAISGSNNIGIGQDPFRNLSSGAGNIAIGQNALNVITSGSNCVAIGTNVLLLNTASDNTGVGINALAANVAGTGQTAFGRSALTLATGSNNTALGNSAGSNITTGTNNICIGVVANASAANINNELVIGSSASFVATNGGATTYYNTASAGAVALPAATLGFIRIYLNGSFVKIAVYGN